MYALNDHLAKAEAQNMMGLPQNQQAKSDLVAIKRESKKRIAGEISEESKSVEKGSHSDPKQKSASRSGSGGVKSSGLAANNKILSEY